MRLMTTSGNEKPAEARLIEAARQAKALSARKAAKLAGISEGRWRQIEKGEQLAGSGYSIPVVAPDQTIARMSMVVGVSAEQLREAGRENAADAMVFMAGMQAENDWQKVGTVLDRLVGMREELGRIIDELSRGGKQDGPAVAD